MKVSDNRGFALITVLLLAALITALLTAYFFLTRVEFLSTKSTLSGNRGFYAAEGGLNVRADQLRQKFEGYNRPSGLPPTPTPGGQPCLTGSSGSGDFACDTHALRDRGAVTFVQEDPGNPSWMVVPPGEPYQNLNAQVYGYDINSMSVNTSSDTEAVLVLHALVRLVPLFQFAAFYDKDLEILPGPAMELEGPVHTNGDLYLDAGTSLTIEGQVTVAGQLFQGRKNSDTCNNNPVAVYDPASPRNLPGCSGTRVEVLPPATAPWNGMIRLGVEELTVPPPETLDPTPGSIYWDKADLRVMLDLNGATPQIELRNPDNTTNVPGTIYLNSSCPGRTPVDSTSGLFHNFRENADIEMLEIDMQELIDCADLNNSVVLGGAALDDSTEGGLVFYFGVDGPDSGLPNNYGVRVSNGASLTSTVSATPIRGLTVVTDQAVYVQGDYNNDAANWKPAAFLADSLNLLSNNWSDANAHDPDLSSRPATDTDFYAAFMAGTDSTGGVEGSGGQDLDIYNGGLENYPRFHEDWGGDTMVYRGSFVSLNLPRHVDGLWQDQSYSPPNRDWRYETRFNDASNLPPLSPRFVSLKQDQFLRSFDL